MDAFEKARLKHAKNLERRERYEAPAPVVVSVPVAEAPKEKESDAVIEVTVKLPNGSLAFRFVKRDVLSNVPNHRLTKNEFRKVLVEGLVPLLGRVDDLR